MSDNGSINLEGDENEPLPFVIHQPAPTIQIPDVPALEDPPSAPSPSPIVFEGDWGFNSDSDSEGSLFDLLNLEIPVVEEWIEDDNTSTVVSGWEGTHDINYPLTDSDIETVISEWEGYAPE